MKTKKSKQKKNLRPAPANFMSKVYVQILRSGALKDVKRLQTVGRNLSLRSIDDEVRHVADALEAKLNFLKP